MLGDVHAASFVVEQATLGLAIGPERTCLVLGVRLRARTRGSDDADANGDLRRIRCLALDEDSRLLTRPPCPRCGSTTRSFQAKSSARLSSNATSRAVRVREYVERNWWWIAVVVAPAVGGVLAKLVCFPGPSIGVAVVIALLGVVVHPRAGAPA